MKQANCLCINLKMKLIIILVLYFNVFMRFASSQRGNNNYRDRVIFPDDLHDEIYNRFNDNYKTESLNMSLIAAARNGNESQLVTFIQQGAHINAMDEFGDTALHAAASAGQAEMVSFLIQNGADSSIRNKYGKSAKDLAIEKSFSHIVNLLSVTQRACSLYINSPTTRIFGGEPAEFPWMASLGYVDLNNKLSFDCGATIISDKFVLTAAHCAHDDRRPVIVRLGKSSLSDDDGIAAQNCYIEKIIKHPKYSSFKKKNDIALIQFVRRVYLSPTLSPACLHIDPIDEDPNVKLTVAGWGRISNQVRDRSNELLKTTVQTMPLNECNQTILNYNKNANLAAYRDGISENQYCARDPNGINDSCEGDSGGPLHIVPVSYSAPSKVLGVVSFSINCGTTFPSIYTRVASYIDWIESHVWPNDEILPPLINYDLFQSTQDEHEQSSRYPDNHEHDIDGIFDVSKTNGSEFIPESPNNVPVTSNFRISTKACKLYSITLNLTPRDEPYGFSWMAALGYINSNKKIIFSCAGTIISDSFIVTAAQCANDDDRRPVVVRMIFTEDHLIKRIFKHPNYSGATKKNDIALIQLADRIRFSHFVRPACLDEGLPNEHLDTTHSFASWNVSSEQLYKIELETIPLSDCNSTILRNGIDKGQFCTGGTSNCDKNGGAPLYQPTNILPQIVGISSQVICDSMVTRVFLRVAHYLDWIEEIVWPNGEIIIPLSPIV